MNIRGFDLESSSPVQQIMAGNPNNWWNNLNMNHHESQQQQEQQQHPSFFPQYTPSSSSSSLMLPPLHDNNQQNLPSDHSWSQLLLGGLVGHEEDRSGLMSNLHHQLAAAKRLENWEEHVLYSTTVPPTDVKHEVADSGYLYRHGNEDFQAPRPTWSPIMSTASSPRSCVTNNMLDFSYTNSDSSGHHQPDNSSDQSKTTTTGGASKKAKTQPCPNQSTFKVRKEKMSDRITTLHQLVSPFGKTDTASVLLEVIGYIRFLQSQIEALSLPYLGRGSSGNMRHQQQSLLNEISLKRRTISDQDPDEDESKKDLRSRGLCLVPVNFTLHLGGSTVDTSADYWAPALGGGFQ